MIRTSGTASWNAPLPPLSAKQLQAAADSHEYAIAHNLVLALETDEHLQYHHSVTVDELLRIPDAERSLAEDHLPLLVLPPTKIDELWTVPRRVAGVLEAACRWLTDDELKAIEEAVVSNRAKWIASNRLGNAAALKLERPLLCTDHDEDCAELQRTTTAFVNRGEDCVRKHGLPLNSSEEEGLFAIPKEASDYAAHLEESIRTETMVVSEHTIRSLMLLMGSMKWTDEDQAAFIDQKLTIPVSVRRFVSPPLPPVQSFEYFVPEGDVCLVSDASDFSSGVSEALEEAERLLTDKTGDVWKDEAVDFDMPTLLSNPPDYSIDNLCPSFPKDPSKWRYESDLSLSPSSISGIPMAPEASKCTAGDDEIFSAWIDESIFEKEDNQDRKMHQHLQDNNNNNNSLDKEGRQRLQDDLSDVCCPDEHFQDLTEESLLNLGEIEIVAQAKISVPIVGIESSLPSWYSVGESPLEMLRWMTHSCNTAFSLERWPLGNEVEKAQQLEKQLNAMTAQYDQQFTETFEVDELRMEKTTSWLKTVPDIKLLLIASVMPIAAFQRGNEPAEEPLEIPEELLKELPKESSKESPEFSPKESPKASQKDSPKGKKAKRPPKQDNNPWGDLMGRFKRRKKETTSGSANQRDIDASQAASQQTIQIKAPELLLGFRAFSDSSMQADEQNDAQDADHDGSLHPCPKPAEEVPALIQDALLVQLATTSSFPKAIFSTAVPRTIRTLLIKLLPNLQFVERDYQQHHAGYDGIDINDEADIVVSPSTGIIVATMVGVRQSDGQRRLVFQNRVATIARKYETLHILIHRNNAKLIGKESGADLPELSPSDATALAQLQGFVRSLPCKVSASYIGGSEQAVAQCMSTLFIQTAEKDGKQVKMEHFLVEEETHWELFLRQAGFNVYDAQIVLGILREASAKDKPVDERVCVRWFMEMPSDERLSRFSSAVGCQSVLARVNQLFTETIPSDNLRSFPNTNT